jgi:hypothetical protein
MTTRLSAIAFTSDIARLTENFTGRQWLAEEIDNWLNMRDEQFLILTGEPGIGKSAFIAHLIQSRKDIAAYHFCRDGDFSTIDPIYLSKSLASQFAPFFTDWSKSFLAQTNSKINVNINLNIESVTDSLIRDIVIEDYSFSDALAGWDLILKPLSNLSVAPSQPILILIDALDGAMTFDATTTIVTLLSKIKDLPNWVRLIFTTRFDLRVLSSLEFLEPYICYLEAESPQNLRDLREYVQQRLSGSEIIDQFQAQQILLDEFAEQLTKSSGGNFLFAKLIVDEIESGESSLDPSAIPRNLHEIYYGYLNRFTEHEWRYLYQPLMEILTVTQESVSFDHLMNFMNVKESDLKQGWGKICQFLNASGDTEGEEVYVIFNNSFRFFLLNKEISKRFWCKAEDGHNRVVDYYLSQIF